MQNGPVLGKVDPLAAKHRIDPLSQSGLLRELHEELNRLIRDSILRVIEIDPRGFGRKPPAAFAIIREQIPQMQAAGLSVVQFEALPGGSLCERSSREW